MQLLLVTAVLAAAETAYVGDAAWLALLLLFPLLLLLLRHALPHLATKSPQTPPCDKKPLRDALPPR